MGIWGGGGGGGGNRTRGLGVVHLYWIACVLSVELLQVEVLLYLLSICDAHHVK